MHKACVSLTFYKSFVGLVGLSCILLVMVLATACSKNSANNQASDKNSQANSNQTDQNAQNAQGAPFTQANIKGDIERISLAISMARDSAKLNKWQEAASQLRGAKGQIDTALSRKPRLQEELEALKVAIDRTIPLVENGAKEADGKLTELQTRIGAIKTNTY
jgi:hypothetical protein